MKFTGIISKKTCAAIINYKLTWVSCFTTIEKLSDTLWHALAILHHQQQYQLYNDLRSGSTATGGATGGSTRSPDQGGYCQAIPHIHQQSGPWTSTRRHLSSSHFDWHFSRGMTCRWSLWDVPCKSFCMISTLPTLKMINLSCPLHQYHFF